MNEKEGGESPGIYERVQGVLNKRISRRKVLIGIGGAAVVGTTAVVSAGIITLLREGEERPFKHKIETSLNTKILLDLLAEISKTADHYPNENVSAFLAKDQNYWSILKGPLITGEVDLDAKISKGRIGIYNLDHSTSWSYYYDIWRVKPGRTVFDPETKTIKGFLHEDGQIRTTPEWPDESYEVYRRVLSKENSSIRVNRIFETAVAGKKPYQKMEVEFDYVMQTEADLHKFNIRFREAFDSRIQPLIFPDYY